MGRRSACMDSMLSLLPWPSAPGSQAFRVKQFGRHSSLSFSLQVAGGGTSQLWQPHGPIAHKKSFSMGLHIIVSVSLENPDKSIFYAYGCGSNAFAFNHHLIFS